MKASKLLAIFLFSSSTLVIPSSPAVATHSEINGCGGGSTEWVPDEVLANFGPACNNHDRCYGTYRGNISEADRLNCDNQFLNEMNQRCESTYDDWYEYPSRGPCYTLAGRYFEAVVALGWSSYYDSQTHARDSRASNSTSGGGTSSNRREYDRISFRNSCSRPLRLVLHSMDRSGEWRTRRYTFVPGELGYLADSINQNVYYFAETTDGSNIVWSGNHSITTTDNGENLQMLRIDTGTTWIDWTQNLTCNT